jgi:hypothetical protein
MLLLCISMSISWISFCRWNPIISIFHTENPWRSQITLCFTRFSGRFLLGNPHLSAVLKLSQRQIQGHLELSKANDEGHCQGETFKDLAPATAPLVGDLWGHPLKNPPRNGAFDVASGYD